MTTDRVLETGARFARWGSTGSEGLQAQTTRAKQYFAYYLNSSNFNAVVGSRK